MTKTRIAFSSVFVFAMLSIILGVVYFITLTESLVSRVEGVIETIEELDSEAIDEIVTAIQDAEIQTPDTMGNVQSQLEDQNAYNFTSARFAYLYHNNRPLYYATVNAYQAHNGRWPMIDTVFRQGEALMPIGDFNNGIYFFPNATNIVYVNEAQLNGLRSRASRMEGNSLCIFSTDVPGGIGTFEFSDETILIINMEGNNIYAQFAQGLGGMMIEVNIFTWEEFSRAFNF